MYVKFKINPINPLPKNSITKLPSKREITIYLDRDLNDVGDWYKEDGYNCIDFNSLSFREINRLSQSNYFFNGQRIHVYYVTESKMGYSQVVNGESDIGWSTFRGFKNWDQIRSEMKVSYQLKKKEIQIGSNTKFKINYKPAKEYEYSSEFNSIGDYIKNYDRRSKYNEIFLKEHFKFFVNNINDYKSSILTRSLFDVSILLNPHKNNETTDITDDVLVS